MPNIAVLQDVGSSTIREIEQLVASGDTGGLRLVGAYWTPDQGRLFSVFEGEGLAPRLAGAGSADIFPVLPITAEEYGPPAMDPAAGSGERLQLVLVRRRLEPMTHPEFRAVALQAIMCAHEYTDMRWLRSYWATEQNELHCLFRTRTHDLVREHARRSRIPCDEVHDAVEVTSIDAPRPSAAGGGVRA